MNKRILIAGLLMIGLFGLTLLAGDPFTIVWDNTLTLTSDGSLLFDEYQSVLQVDYRVSPFTSTSRSEIQRCGFLWQEFNIHGDWRGFGIQADILFGPSTSDYLYTQLIAEMNLAGIHLGLYFAQLSNAVLGGAADGFAIRVTGSIGSLGIVSTTEFGARVADEDFDGIAIVHTASGFSRSYATDPVVAGQGFTGQKVAISGFSIGCVEDIKTTLYVTCAGFDFISFELSDIELGISWLIFDLAVKFEVQTKTVTLTPRLAFGESLCFTPYFTLTPTETAFTIDGIILGGLGLTYSSNGVTIRDVTVLHTGRYTITTPQYGSVLETIEDAVENGHEYYADFWELLSIEVDGDACCGGGYRVLINTYFDRDSTGIFGIGMMHIEGSVGIGSSTVLSTHLTVDTNGTDSLGFGFKAIW